MTNDDGAKWVTVYRDAKRSWRWRATAANGRIVNVSEQGYRARWYCARKARRVYPDTRIRYLP